MYAEDNVASCSTIIDIAIPEIYSSLLFKVTFGGFCYQVYEQNTLFYLCQPSLPLYLKLIQAYFLEF